MRLVFPRQIISQFDQPLAQVLPAIEPGDGVGRLLEAFENVLAVAELALADPLRELRHGLLRAVLVVEDEEAFHARALDEEMPLDARTRRPRVPARHRGGAANDDAGAL